MFLRENGFIMILLAPKMFGKLAHMKCCLQHMRSWHSLRQRDWLLSRLIFVLTHLASMHPEFCLAILIAVTPFSSTLVANICKTTWLLAQWRNMQELPFLVRFYTLTLLHWNCGQFILRAWALALNTCMLSCVYSCKNKRSRCKPADQNDSQADPRICLKSVRMFITNFLPSFRSIGFLKSEVLLPLFHSFVLLVGLKTVRTFIALLTIILQFDEVSNVDLAVLLPFPVNFRK